MAAYAGPEIVEDGLVLYLDAANERSYPGSGNTWYDLSGNSNSLTTYNGASFVSDNLGSVQFDGSNDYASNSSLFLGTDPLFSIVLWVKCTSSFSGAGYWGMGGGTVNSGINGYCAPGRINKIGIDLWGRSTFDTQQEYPLNQWVNVAWVKETSGFTTSAFSIYINAVQYPLNYIYRNNSSTVSLVPGVSTGRVGHSVGSYHAPGIIGAFAIFDYSLNSSEVTRNFNATRSRFGI
jgi:hypothetical protein